MDLSLCQPRFKGYRNSLKPPKDTFKVSLKEQQIYFMDFVIRKTVQFYVINFSLLLLSFIHICTTTASKIIAND